MPEWLTADPLNGLVITISFFISVIIGRHFRKKRILNNNGRRFFDPRIKMLLVFLLIISITLMKKPYIPIVFAAICFLISLKLNKYRDFSHKLFFPALLASFIVITQSLTYGTNKINYWNIPVYSEGIESGILIFSKVLASASIAVLFLSTASGNEITGSMRWYGIPATMLDISSLMSRYITAFSSEARKLELAQESRCGFSKRSGYKKKIQQIASITGMLITRAYGRSEMVYRAMLSRGWKPGAGSIAAHQPLRKEDIFFGLVFSTGLIIFIGIDRIL